MAQRQQQADRVAFFLCTPVPLAAMLRVVATRVSIRASTSLARHAATSQSAVGRLQQQQPQPALSLSRAAFHSCSVRCAAHPSSFTSTFPASSPPMSEEERNIRMRAELDRLQREEDDRAAGRSEMTPEERATTGPDAETSEIPRTGPMPLNPYRQLTQAEIECTDGASCPSWPWDHSPHAKNNEAIALLRSLPYPHPLPPVYTQSAGYRPSPELRRPWQRLLHVLSVVLCVAIPAVVFFGIDTEVKARPGTVAAQRQAQQGAGPLYVQQWMQQRVAELARTPAEVRAMKLRALGVSEDQLPEISKQRRQIEQLKADLAKQAQITAAQRQQQ